MTNTPVEFNTTLAQLLADKVSVEEKVAQIHQAMKAAADAAAEATGDRLGYGEASDKASEYRGAARKAYAEWLQSLSDQAWAGKLPYRVIYVTWEGRFSLVIGAAAVTPAGFPWEEGQKVVEAYHGIRQHQPIPHSLSCKGGVAYIYSRQEGAQREPGMIDSLEEWQKCQILFEVDPELLKTNTQEMALLRAYLLEEVASERSEAQLLAVWQEYFPGEDFLAHVEPGTSWNLGSASHHSGNIEASLMKLPSGRWAIISSYDGDDSCYSACEGVVESPRLEEVEMSGRNASVYVTPEPAEASQDELTFISSKVRLYNRTKEMVEVDVSEE